MAGRNRTKEITGGILDQHIALSVAAGLARTQLVPDPLKPYDEQHHSDLLDAVARGFTKVAALYVIDAATGALRQLTPLQLEGATVSRGATRLVLKDGRFLSGVSIKRADLRQAVAILKAIGIQELTGRREPPAAPKASAPGRIDPLAVLNEIEGFLRPPLVPAQVERANSLAVSLARRAPQGRIANLAMQLISAVLEERNEPVPELHRVKLALMKLRAALENDRAGQDDRAEPRADSQDPRQEIA